MRTSRRSFALAMAALTASAAGPSAHAQPAAAATQQVRSVVEQYLHGLKHNDVASLKQAFWPDAKLYFVGRDGKLGQLTQADWYKSFEKSAGKEEAGDFRIAAVEVTNDIATVKVVEDWPGNSRYTDYLSLVRFDGAWKIVNKVYTSEKR